MPMNHYSSGIPEAVWWTQQQPLMEPAQQNPSSVTVSQPNTLWANHQFYNHLHPAAAASSMFCGQNSAFSLNLNQEEDEEVVEEPPVTDERERGESMTIQQQQQLHGDNINKDKEPMFEKPLTPSDVGKLNRLVIPKQHAEKYFPLCGGGDSATDKGLLLSFEDESGKCWRFRYSYWNSSQSYVLTKGWSRFVKEKQLEAGDVVLFDRHRLDCDRLFIGSRRRPTVSVGHETGVAQPAAVEVAAGGGGGGGGGWTPLFYFSHPHGHGPLPPYQPDCLHAGAVVQSQTTPSGNSKRLRLFGVNLECQLESEPCNPDGSSVSSQGQAHYYQYYCTNAQPPNLQSHMDINFSRDVSPTRYPQG